MGMQYLRSTSLTTEQTEFFTALDHLEDPWRHNDTSEKIENNK